MPPPSPHAQRAALFALRRLLHPAAASHDDGANKVPDGEGIYFLLRGGL